MFPPEELLDARVSQELRPVGSVVRVADTPHDCACEKAMVVGFESIPISMVSELFATVGGWRTHFTSRLKV